MKRYTLQQCIEIVKIHYKNGENFSKTIRKVKSFLGRRKAPSRPAIVKLVKKFELLGQVSDMTSEWIALLNTYFNTSRLFSLGLLER